MSTTTPDGSENSASPASVTERDQSGSSHPVTSADTAAQDGQPQEAPEEAYAGAGAASVRRSLAERFAASSGRAGHGSETAGVEDPDSARTRPVSPSHPAADDGTGVMSTASADEPAVAGPRRVRLSLSRVDPWSIMKLAFLLSIAIGIGIVVATAVVWFVLDSMQVFADIEELLISIGSEDLVQLMEFVEFDRVISMATIIAVVDVLLLTALSTIGAFVYNLVAALVGGLHVTLTDD